MGGGFSRRDFLKGSLVGGVMLGTGFGHHHSAHAQANLRFSTWHVPVGYEVKTVWVPMLEELKKRSKDRLGYTMFAEEPWAKAPNTTTSWPRDFPTSDTLPPPGLPEVPPDRRSFPGGVGGRERRGHRNRECHVQTGPPSGVPGVKMVEMNGCIQAFLWTKKPIRSLEDVKGKKIRSPEATRPSTLKLWEPSPSSCPGGCVPGHGDGDGGRDRHLPPLVISFKLHEVAKFGLVTTFGCVSEGVIMNGESWKRVPTDLKPVFDEVCTNPFHTTGGLNREVYKAMMKEICRQEGRAV